VIGRYRRPILRTPADGWEGLGDGRAGPAPLLAALTPLLDGRHGVEQVWGRLLARGFPPEAIQHAFDLLEQAGLLEEGDPLTPGEHGRYAAQIDLFAQAVLAHQSRDTADVAWRGVAAQAALKRALVVVVDLGALGSELVRMLALAGVGRIVGVGRSAEARPAEASPAPAPLAERVRALNPYVEFLAVEQVEDLPAALHEARPGLVVYGPDEFDDELCQGLNRLTLDQGFPFLPARPRGWFVDLGPLVIPRQTACYVCYERRRRAARPPWEEGESSAAPRGTLAHPLGADWLAVEVVKFLAEVAEPVTRGRLLRLNYLSGLPEVHPVLKLPRCPACGVHQHLPARKLWEE